MNDDRLNIDDLIKKYDADKPSRIAVIYNETQLRNDFIDPLLKCFGWDVDNTQGKTQFLRDVIQEEAIDIEGESSKKSPDYTLRINGIRKLFVEAKKPGVNIVNSTKSAFQIRRYGWNANLGISILTNFEHLIIYDCRFKPDSKDNERVARVHVFHYKDFVSSYDEIHKLISYQSATNGVLDSLFSVYENVGETFDNYFLEQIENWRTLLAQSAIERNEKLDSNDVNLLIQRLLNRIVFLRICEDRSIEKFETLKNIKDFDQLKELFKQSDKKYNSGLFDFIEDDLSLKIDLDSSILIQIFNELYYPLSPYDFAVVDPTILSQIYERFLGSTIQIDEKRNFSVVNEPEVAASNGVVPTPKLIVEQIIKETLLLLTEGKNSTELTNLKIADICCGSGTFLISAFDFLVQKTIESYLDEGINNLDNIYESGDDILSLTLHVKRNILANNLYGVDINPYATEVTEFSLLLKLLEGENKATVDNYIAKYSNKVLPSLRNNIKCGNSLVSSTFFDFMPDALDDNELLYRIKPFDWIEEFPFLRAKKGFDAIIGNPPYVRIQNLVKYAPEEIQFYQSSKSGYSVAKKDSVDKYYVFIQCAINLLNDKGFLGYIVPHKFFLIKGGGNLRKFITENSQIAKIIHFGISQVFPNHSTYTAVLVLQKEKVEQFIFRRSNAKSLTSVFSTEYKIYNTSDYHSDPWVFLSLQTKNIFNKLYEIPYTPLGKVANICVGLQTSADPIYIFTPESETESTFKFIKKEVVYEVEKKICLPCIYDLSFGAFDTISPNAFIIFPYKIKDGKAVLFSEIYFEKEYPLCWNYLNDHKTALGKRNLQGKTPSWYEFGRSQSLIKFHNTRKMIWSVLATKAPYIIDENNIQFTGGGNGPYYSLINNSHYSLEYFMAVLSHPMIETMVKTRASEFRGAYYSHGKQFLENIPIPYLDFTVPEEKELHDTIVKVVKNIIKTKTQYSNEYTKRSILARKLALLQTEMTNLVNQLYNIDNDDLENVLADELFTNELNTIEE